MQVVRQTKFTQGAALDVTLYPVGAAIFLQAGYMQPYPGTSLQKGLQAGRQQFSAATGQLESLGKTIVSIVSEQR